MRSRGTLMGIAIIIALFAGACVPFRSPGSDLILVGSRRPLSLDREDLERRWGDPVIRREMGQIGFPRPEALLAHFLTGPQDVGAILKGAPINTDDNMLVEFRAPADIYTPQDAGRSFESLGLVLTPVESVLRDPDRRLRRRDSLRAPVDALVVGKWPAGRYQALLAGP